MKLRYIPNILSVIRLSLVPLFIYLFFKGENVSAVVVFAISGVTDFLDGFIARKYDCASNLGKLLDPMADTLTQFSAFLCLYIEELVPVWMVIVYFVKDSFILEIHNLVTLSFEKFFKVGSLIHFLLSLLRYSLHTVKYYPS